MSFFVYMLECADGTIYTGQTDDLDQRVGQHHSGHFLGCYTRKRRPLILLWSDWFETRMDALEVERKLKGWSAAQKRALVAGDWELVSELARNRTGLRQAQP